MWYLCVRDEFIICGACVSTYDEAIFYWHYKNTLQSVVCSLSDELFWRGSQVFKNKVICVNNMRQITIAKRRRSRMLNVVLLLFQKIIKEIITVNLSLWLVAYVILNQFTIIESLDMVIQDVINN